MNFNLPKIYPITDTSISGLSHVDQVEQLIAGGAEIIQLREKLASPGEFCISAKSAIEIAHQHGVRIIINDRVDIALALKSDGVHLGQDDLSPAEARVILGSEAIIGFSTHTIDQVIEAIMLPIDYIAFGPVFITRTKKNPDPTVGIETLRAVRNVIGDLPLVAIGGIDANNVNAVIDSGADSAALISAILREPFKIQARMSEFIELCMV